MGKYSTFSQRLWAGIIDGLVFVPLNFVDSGVTPQSHGAFLFVGWCTVSYTSVWLYSVLLHARFGQTLGKMAMKIKVVDLSQDRLPTLRQALLRDIGYIVINTLTLVYIVYLLAKGQYVPGAEESALPRQILMSASAMWFFLEIATMLTNEQRRAFHDFLAGTVVTQEA